MTEKLFYQDSHLTEFTATVLSQEQTKKGWRLVLDRTAFYPEGGGQASDHGIIGGQKVLDVQKEGNEIAHYLEHPPTDKIISCTLDWPHRFHAMQQHTGQHILSAVFWKIGDLTTVSVHLGDEYTTIEFETSELSAETIQQAEEQANQIINRNIPVLAVYPESDELENYTLRRPCTHKENIRLITIENFDWVACGGVHCPTTGEVGLVKNIGLEKIRGNVRTIWKIGRDAYRDYHEKNEIVTTLRAELNASDNDITTRIRQLSEELTQVKRERNLLETQLAQLTAHDLLLHRESISEHSFDMITHLFSEENDRIFRDIAKVLIKEDNLVSCLVNRHPNRFDWIVCCSETIDFPFNSLKNVLVERTGIKGGGRPPLWQGIGPDPTAAESFIETFRTGLKNT